MNIAALLMVPSLVQAASPAKPKPPVVALAAVEQSPRQQAIVKSLTHWALICPPDSEDPAMQDLARQLGALRKTGDAPMTEEGVQDLQTRFDGWKDALAHKLHTSSSQTDEQAFRRDLEAGVQDLAALAEKTHISAEDAKKARKELATLRKAIGPLAANYFFDRAKTQGSVGLLAAARAEGASGNAKIFTNYRYTNYVGTPRVLRPGDNGAVPLELASYTETQPTSASSWSLSSVISSVSGTAKRYAGKVSDAIVNFSHQYGIDDRLEAAFVWVESAFNPHATSGSGAMGLGQLMPGTAAGLGVHNAYDIDQNIRGSASFIKTLLAKFATPDEIRYTQGLYAYGKTRVERGESADQVRRDVFAKTPLGVKNAIAAYNAGAGAITVYAKGNYENLPRSYSREAEASGKGYWQTIHYVPAVLNRYFDIYLKTPTEQGGPSIFTA
jgi:soluble lytic murein transglycosylase-like protein